MITPDNHDTIAAIATPLGSAGIGIIRISGPESIPIARRIFISERFTSAAPIARHLYYGRIIDPNDSTMLDDVLLACMPGPHSYTGDDVVEINCHGGLTGLRAVLELVLACGARTATPGEFTRRAFLNGRLDLAQAEAVIDMIESQNEVGLKIAARQMSGALSVQIEQLRRVLIDLRAHLEACIDFPDDEIDILSRDNVTDILNQQCEQISTLIADSEHANCYRTGIDAVIVGKPNVGKSSIMNVLLGDERSIVTSIPGTTRDVIRETITIAGIPVRLHDTAGIHSSTDAVETIGMDKSLDHLKTADITLLVFDGSRKLDSHDHLLLSKKQPGNCIALINKSDLKQHMNSRDLEGALEKDLIQSVSAVAHTGFKELRDSIANLVLGDDTPTVGDVLITSLRHKQALVAALNALQRAHKAAHANRAFELISADVQEALHGLGEITGETTTEDILESIFSRFCIGK
jgi:tRNA modification GTPase